MNKKKKIIIVSIVSIVLIVVLALATSYALFNINITKNKIFRITMGNLELTMNDDNNTLTDGKIVVNRMVPMKDTTGMEQDGYTFSLTNTGTINAQYAIYLDDVTLNNLPNGITGRLDNDLVRINLTNTTTNTSNTYTLSEISNRIVEIGTLSAGANNTNNYILRIWMDYSADNSAQNKYFAAKLRIDSFQSNENVTFPSNGVLLAGDNISFGNNNMNITQGSSKTVTITPLTGYYISSGGCTNGYNITGLTTGSTATSAQTITITNTGTIIGSKCTFKTVSMMHTDNSSANPPELYAGLVPIKYSNDGQIYKADVTEEWYDYDAHEWANAAILTTAGKAKTTSQALDPSTDIYQMYVWIPRYRYKLWNAENGLSNEQSIEIEFEDSTTPKSTGSTNNTWLTHPAFTFGTTELNGFWVGKFESGYADATSGSEGSQSVVDATKVVIKPNAYSWRGIPAGYIFNTARGVENEAMYGLMASQVDTHAIKNMEWGAVAYLSHSIYGRYDTKNTCITSGCQVWNNPNYNNLTGYSGNEVAIVSDVGYPWNDSTYGGNSSTTGNLYGIYDMSGGASEYVMAEISNSNTFTWTKGWSQLDEPDGKYYDAYTNSESSTYAYSNGKLGDATREILKYSEKIAGGWYDDFSKFPCNAYIWFVRGGMNGYGNNSGIFGYEDSVGSGNYYSWRMVLSAE